MFSLKQSTHRMIIQYHPKVGYVFVPNQRARLDNGGSGFFLKTNSLGFRSDWEFRKEKGHLPRILMFGDSYTAGDNCSNQERFSDKLGEILNAEVYNYGISGSGTDQHLLIFREFAKDVQADIAVICVQADSIRRIMARSRKTLDRISGKYVMVSKPYFALNGDELVLHNVPVPRERPLVSRDDESGMAGKLKKIYREYKILRMPRQIIRSSLKKINTLKQPYPDYLDDSSRAWMLMKTILKQFCKELSPMPVLIVPIPSQEFYLHGLEPVYQPLFETLSQPEKGIHVLDITTPLMKIAPEKRHALTHRIGGHFSTWANEIVAESLAEQQRKLNLNIFPAEKTQSTRGASIPPKKTRDHFVLGISCFYHNSAAALLKNGEILAAAEEERFTRVKNDRRFPQNSVNFCLEEAGINPENLDAVVYYDNASLTFERIMHSLVASGETSKEMWMCVMPPWIQYKLHIPEMIRKYMNYDGLILQSNHHRSHAASAFYPSPFRQAAILTADGVGEWGTASIGYGNGSKIKIIKEMQFPNSIGLLYSAFTEFTGFKVNSGEYKMMGLAPYGRPIYKKLILDKLISLKNDGSIELNMEYFSFLDNMKMTNEKFAELFGGPSRKQDSRITRREMDIAKSVQEVTEEVILRMARTAYELTGEKKLCMAGGVALNCVANGRLLREGPFKEIWIQPAAGDSGCALGAAYDVWHEYFLQDRHLRDDGLPAQMASCWGPAFSEHEVKAYLDTHGFPYRHIDEDEKAKVLSTAVADGKIVGHFSGRLEFGPRALGNRSIIGDPRNASTQVDMNLKIKYRESFRPFAPSVLREDVAEYFEINCDSPYMLLVAPVRADRRIPFQMPENFEDMLEIVKQPRSDISAITHVDFSARIQTVSRELSSEYYRLIKNFKDKTTCAVVVNTSFNVRGEPIVCTPADAYRCFMRTEMNILAIGNFVLIKEEQPEWPEGKGVGLEDEKNDVVTTKSIYNRRFLEKLRLMHKEEFIPLVEKLKLKGKLKISHSVTCQSSSWMDYNEPSDIKKIFEYGAAMLDRTKGPERLAEEIVAVWQHKDDVPEMKPILLKLLVLGLEFPAKLNLDEDVPDSVYAMF